MDIITGVASILVGGGLLAFAQFLISRHDAKNDKFKDVFELIEKLSEKIDALDKKGDERNAVSARVRILRFADELQDDRARSKDAWDQVMSDATEYTRYCDKNPDFRNGQTAATVELLTEQYKQHLEHHDFL